MKTQVMLLAVMSVLVVQVVANGQGKAPDRASAETELAPNYEKYATLDKLIGVWDTKAVSNGEKIEGTFRCRWAPGRHCAVWTLEVYEPGKPDTVVERMNGIMGWNATEECLMEQVYMSNGILLMTKWRPTGNKLIGDRHGVDAEGRKLRSLKPVELDFEKKGELRIAPFRYVTEDGEVAVEYTDIVWHRRARDKGRKQR